MTTTPPPNPPVLGQDDWQSENIHYLAKDEIILAQVLPFLHSGDYILEEDEDGSKVAVVTVTLRLSILDH